MEELKTSELLYSKIQKVIDKLDGVFFSGKARKKYQSLYLQSIISAELVL